MTQGCVTHSKSCMRWSPERRVCAPGFSLVKPSLPRHLRAASQAPLRRKAGGRECCIEFCSSPSGTTSPALCGRRSWSGWLFAPLLFGGGLFGIAILRVTDGNKDKRIAILDRTGVAAAAIIQAAEEKNQLLALFGDGPNAQGHYVFETVAVDEGDPNGQRLALSNRIRRGELFAFFEVKPQALHPAEGVTAENLVAYYTNARAGSTKRRSGWRSRSTMGSGASGFLNSASMEIALNDVIASVPMSKNEPRLHTGSKYGRHPGRRARAALWKASRSDLYCSF